MNPKALTPAKFRRIAEKYFNNPKDINAICGICRNLTEEFGRHDNVGADESYYGQMDKLMQQIGYGSNFKYEESVYDYYVSNYYTTEAWQSRAWMCLFMAEFLEDGTIVGSL